MDGFVDKFLDLASQLGCIPYLVKTLGRRGHLKNALPRNEGMIDRATLRDDIRAAVEAGLGKDGAVAHSHNGELLSVKAAAMKAGVSDKTVRRWIQAGRLKATKIGRQYRILKTELDEFVTGLPDAPRFDPEREAARILRVKTTRSNR
jgi:excisionase family DNA binding protein